MTAMNEDPFTAKPSATKPFATCFLAHAAYQGEIGGVYVYLTQGADINALVDGRPPLLWAISRGHKGVMTVLLAKGADIMQETEGGDEALSCAVWSGDTYLVQWMLEKGFEPLHKNKDGKTALDWAEAGGKADIINLLRDRAIELAHRCSATRQQNLNAKARQKKFRPGL
jgi:ankyrin repeat protein